MDSFASKTRILLLPALLLAAGGCNREPPARSVQEFKDNPILLEAAVVRCAENRSETRYTQECMNAREAVKLLEAAADAERRKELEAQSERKRQALRRTQQAAAEARRRAAEEAARRREAEYLAQFGELPPPNGELDTIEGNAPVAVLPETPQAEAPAASPGFESPYDEPAAPAARPDNAPVVDIEPPSESPETDLNAIREELRRRGDDNNGTSP